MCREGARGHLFSHQHANNVAIDSANNKHFAQRSAKHVTEPRPQLGSILATFSFAVGQSKQCTLEAAEYKPVRRSQLDSVQTTNNRTL